jgi:hypothetical protein
MSAASIINQLRNVKRTKTGWMASCPGPNHSHGDRHQSLVISEGDNGTVLLFCYGGCSASEIVAAVGMELSDLFPETTHNSKPNPAPFSAWDALVCLEVEAGIVVVAGADLAAGKALSEADHARLLLAVERISTAMTVVKPRLRKPRGIDRG